MVVRIPGVVLLAAAVLAAPWGTGAASAELRGRKAAGGGSAAERDERLLELARPRRPSQFPAEVAIWSDQRRPAAGPARVYGRTTCGCVAGAVPLPARGEGFVRRRTWRPTNFGHPDLVRFVERLGGAARRQGLGDLVIGDLSLPRGGAYQHGHSSHQTGLDVDIAYRAWAESAEERVAGAGRAAASAVSRRSQSLTRIEVVLRLAAADAQVDRIFVGAGLKELLCRSATGDREFLAVLRPWLGHEQHFHVRLKCPADSPDCRPNEPAVQIPDDCEALSGWWKHANLTAAFAAWRAAGRATYLDDLPDECHALAEPTRSLAQMAPRRTASPPRSRAKP